MSENFEVQLDDSSNKEIQQSTTDSSYYPDEEQKSIPSDDIKETLNSLKDEIGSESPKDDISVKRETKKSLPSSMYEIFLEELKEKQIDEILELLDKVYDVKSPSYRNKLDLLFKVVDNHNKMGGVVYARGVLQILNDQNQGYGFLRSEEHNYLAGAGDIYVSQTQIRSLGLRTGDEVFGTIRAPLRDNEKYFGLLKVLKVNGKEFTGNLQKRPSFDKLTPMFPTEKFSLEYSKTDIDTRIIDIFVPIGKGQRGIIVSQPKAGKTTILKKIATAIRKNHPDVIIFILLIDERPEEVTDWKRSLRGVQVISSTFDEEPFRHSIVAEMVLERAKRLVEDGNDVVILLDSLTRLTRAYNLITPPSGRVMSGGIEVGAFYKPKHFFGSARKVEEGGSLTIIASALIDTGSKMDEVIYEEFKGTGNMEIHLDRNLANKRIFPAIDLKLSGTRREELLLREDVLNKMWLLRRALNDFSNEDIIQKLTEVLQKTKNNEEFLSNLQSF
ncbi:MAG: transcription termination factor Rho [Spirochaetia bacterium]|nr:transcription termination factor Rho [Spirochaetota bacterium]MCX8096034.1 transcription termination factor Rho [Spirochaetota bacterium]MDW8111829.1 transcription termination factor Rho [Spirochaetia bacterium]